VLAFFAKKPQKSCCITMQQISDNYAISCATTKKKLLPAQRNFVPCLGSKFFLGREQKGGQIA